MANNATLEKIQPFFIVKNLADAIDFYNQKLGFETDLLIPEDDPFFAIVSRDNVRILLKHITPDTLPVPNHTRHEWARWDAFILVSDPDALFTEFQSRGLTFHETLADTDDGLRAFELKDHDGYVLCFGKPL
ncbi:MAG: VOC family protein [Candidatus Poribacteria bacterium]|nr:VOC family protein [Candidatus Poribacteria bacterium]